MLQRKVDRTGRSTNSYKLKKHQQIAGQFIPHRVEMLESPAWRALSFVARRILDRLEIEHAGHGGAENGRLICTYDDFVGALLKPPQNSAAISPVILLSAWRAPLPSSRQMPPSVRRETGSQPLTTRTPAPTTRRSPPTRSRRATSWWPMSPMQRAASRPRSDAKSFFRGRFRPDIGGINAPRKAQSLGAKMPLLVPGATLPLPSISPFTCRSGGPPSCAEQLWGRSARPSAGGSLVSRPALHKHTSNKPAKWWMRYLARGTISPRGPKSLPSGPLAASQVADLRPTCVALAYG